MKKFAMAAMVWLAATTVQAADLPNYPFIHVQGVGRTYAIPDIGEINFEVNVVNADPERSRALIEERLAAVKSLLATHAVPEGDVSVRDVRRDIPKGEAAPATYRLKSSVRIKVSTLASWAQIVTGLLAMPDLDEFAVFFDVSNRTEAETELMAQALKNARKKAVDIAAGVGRKLGPANGVSTGEVRNISRVMGFADTDFSVHDNKGGRPITGRDNLLTIEVVRLGQTVNVIYGLK